MLPRTLLVLTVVAFLAPAGSLAQDQEWEEEYADEWADYDSEYDVSVDVGGSGDVTFDTFYEPLSPYGEWVSVPSYGRVWRPRVAAGWRPYYYGRWEWTNEGWLWVSDEPFGWAAYHYGRWSYDSYYGWVWVPGYQWAPAWVYWRYSGDVVGWAPLAPGLSIYVSSYPFVDFWWTFVPTVRFVSVPVYSVAYAPSFTRHHWHRTAPAPARPAPRPGVARAAPAPAWGGPAPRAVEQRIGRRLAPARVVAAPSPSRATVRSGEIQVYRPEGRTAPSRRGAAASVGRGNAGAGFAPAPGRGERGSALAPRADRDGDRGVAPAPGRGGDRGEGAARAPSAPPREDRGQPARAGGDDESRRAAPAWSRPERERRGDGNGAARPRREDRGSSAPAYRPSPPRGDSGGGNRASGGGAASRPSGGGRGGGGGDRPAPAPRR
jgi:hypothetical protein